MKKKELTALLKDDKERLLVLNAVRGLKLPQCYIAAGFVRNLVWDHLHKKKTRWSDVDVIFFDPDDKENKKAEWAQKSLSFRYPSIKWQVKNQALMHKRNGDVPYSSCADAMAYWPEKETAVAVRLNEKNQLDVIHAFGLESLFNGFITYNPKRELSVFNARINEKGWLTRWPNLKVVY